MRFKPDAEDLKLNTFYMNYIKGSSNVYAFYLTDELFENHNCGDVDHYAIKPVYNCAEVVAVSPTYHPDPNEEDKTLMGDYVYELTEEEGLLIGDLFI